MPALPAAEKEEPRLRPLTAGDQALLDHFLWESLWDPPDGPRRDRAILDNPFVRAYVEDWGSRPDDLGFVATTVGGEPMGVVWSRLLLPPRAGGAFFDAHTPQLGIALDAAWRGRGIGGRLFAEHLAHADRRYHAISLGMHPRNEIAGRLYARAGFVRFATGRGDYPNLVRLNPCAEHRSAFCPPGSADGAPASITVRAATAADLPRVSAILQEAARWLEARGQALWKPSDLEPEKIGAGVTDYLVAEQAGIPAGVVKFQLEDRLFWPDVPAEESAFVHRLAVRRAFAGSGVARTLLDAAANRARELGRRWLRLDCAADRPALRAVYERHGFVHHSDRTLGSFRAARYEFRLTPPAATG